VDSGGQGMTKKKKSALGRPPKFEGKRYSWSIRVQERYGDQIKAFAQKEGLSISEACERQIINASRMEHIINILEEKNDKLTEDRRIVIMHNTLLQTTIDNDKRRIVDLEAQIAEAKALNKTLQKRQDELFSKLDESIELLQRPAVSAAVDAALGVTPEIAAIIDLAVKRGREEQAAERAKETQPSKKVK
jgi:predicted transcriptional regulator